MFRSVDRKHHHGRPRTGKRHGPGTQGVRVAGKREAQHSASRLFEQRRGKIAPVEIGRENGQRHFPRVRRIFRREPEAGGRQHFLLASRAIREGI